MLSTSWTGWLSSGRSPPTSLSPSAPPSDPSGQTQTEKIILLKIWVCLLTFSFLTSSMSKKEPSSSPIQTTQKIIPEVGSRQTSHTEMVKAFKVQQGPASQRLLASNHRSRSSRLTSVVTPRDLTERIKELQTLRDPGAVLEVHEVSLRHSLFAYCSG